MLPRRLDENTILVPFSEKGPDGLIADGMKTVTKDDPEYDSWAEEADAPLVELPADYGRRLLDKDKA